MNRAKSLFLLFLVLGIGSICWALTNIAAQSVHFSGAYYRSYPGPTDLKGITLKMTGGSAAPAEPDQPYETLVPEKVLYPVYPEEGDSIGILSIPALKRELPIVQGTDAGELKKGVGHFTQSVLPGEEDNCVLSGHRDTVFTKLDKLKIDDQLIVQTSAGTYTYKIKQIRIVDKDDKTVIVPADHAVLTLTTCYPFIFIGNAPQRYILVADLEASE